MTFLRKAAIVVAAAAMTIGLAGVSSPANATDTGWDCPGKLQGPHEGQVTAGRAFTAHHNCTQLETGTSGRPPMAGFLRPTPRPVS